MRVPILVFLIFILNSVQANDGYPRNESIDILHYYLQLELNDSTDRLSGETVISIRFTKAVTGFELDLIKVDQQGKGMTVSGVWMDDQPVTYLHQDDRLKIDVVVAAGSEKKIIIRYSGVPRDGLIIRKNMFGDRTFFADNWPNRAHHWFPSIDHPYEKATCEFVVTAPEHYSVIATGIKTEESLLDRHKKITHWKTNVVLPTKVMVIGVARFAVEYLPPVDGVPVQSWVYPQNRAYGFSDYSIAGKILDYFCRNIGPYPYEKLANVQSTTVYGGMENAGNIFYYEKSVTGKGKIEGLFAHEIAHQWFGDSASEDDWHHFWLSEGFATYFTNLYLEKTYGRDRLIEEMKTDRRQVLDYYKRSPKPIVDLSITDYRSVLNVNSYQKGSWVLHMLRHEVGDQKFWEGIRNYYRQYQFSNALTDDFRKVMEKTSGKDLSVFFDQWIMQKGHPVLSIKWKYNASKKRVQITLEQKQENLFRFNMEFGLRTPTGDLKKEKKEILERKTEFFIPIETKPAALEPDPDVWLLFGAEVEENP